MVLLAGYTRLNSKLFVWWKANFSSLAPFPHYLMAWWLVTESPISLLNCVQLYKHLVLHRFLLPHTFSLTMRPGSVRNVPYTMADCITSRPGFSQGDVVHWFFMNAHTLHTGADITDYFNYGFTEETWKLYNDKQRRLRAEVQQLNKIAVSFVQDKPPLSEYWYCSSRRHDCSRGRGSSFRSLSVSNIDDVEFLHCVDALFDLICLVHSTVNNTCKPPYWGYLQNSQHSKSPVFKH